MPQIQQLPPHIADLISAGEVVERPASVAKELLENAIDAGARAVTVEIRRGGMTYLRVTDDGCGIPADQAQTAFLRHATSKIRHARDLEAIGTLGFRGEALAAIAAVSRVSLTTRPADRPLGVSLTLEGGAVVEQEETGCPAGTTVIVRDLFFNTPARLKFVKKDPAEGAAVFAVVQKTALSHPEVSVRFLRDGRQDLHTPGNGQLKSAVYSVLGRDIALGLIDIEGSGEDIGVSGFVSLPSCCRGSRGNQFFFVNGRNIQSRLLMAAVEQAYQNRKLVGRFPACVVHLRVKCASVDVNVHPSKQEVKFSREQPVFHAVYGAVQAALDAACTRPALFDGQEQTAPPIRPPVPAPAKPAGSPAPHPPLSHPPIPRASASPAPARAPDRSWNTPLKRLDQAAAITLYDCAAETPRQASVPEAEPDKSEPAAEPWRLIGEAFRTYLLVEQGDRLILIDKHAAHERLNFDRLKAADHPPMRQCLLTPVIFTPPAEEREALLAHRALLEQFGFALEEFGGGDLAVRQAPDYIASDEIPAVLSELAARLLEGRRTDPGSARDALLRTMACKAAIKGGQKNDPAELEKLAQAVLSGQAKYCPHGRPVAIELTRAQLEKRFQRT